MSAQPCGLEVGGSLLLHEGLSCGLSHVLAITSHSTGAVFPLVLCCHLSCPLILQFYLALALIPTFPFPFIPTRRFLLLPVSVLVSLPSLPQSLKSNLIAFAPTLGSWTQCNKLPVDGLCLCLHHRISGSLCSCTVSLLFLPPTFIQ